MCPLGRAMSWVELVLRKYCVCQPVCNQYYTVNYIVISGTKNHFPFLAMFLFVSLSTFARRLTLVACLKV